MTPAATPITITYADAVAAAAGPTRFYLAAPIAALPDGHPTKRVVAFMCVYAREILTGRLPGPYSDDDAERFARTALIDPAILARYPHAADRELADLLGVPVEQLTARRVELDLDLELDLEAGNVADRVAPAPLFLLRPPTPADELRALWAMTPAQRVAAMRRGELTVKQCFAWAARHPEQVPTSDGIFEFLVDDDIELAS